MQAVFNVFFHRIIKQHRTLFGIIPAHCLGKALSLIFFRVPAISTSLIYRLDLTGAYAVRKPASSSQANGERFRWLSRAVAVVRMGHNGVRTDSGIPAAS